MDPDGEMAAGSAGSPVLCGSGCSGKLQVGYRKSCDSLCHSGKRVYQKQDTGYRQTKLLLIHPLPQLPTPQPPLTECYACPGRTRDKATESLKMPSAHLVDMATVRTAGFSPSLPIRNKCMNVMREGGVLKGAAGAPASSFLATAYSAHSCHCLYLKDKSPDLTPSGGLRHSPLYQGRTVRPLPHSHCSEMLLEP